MSRNKNRYHARESGSRKRDEQTGPETNGHEPTDHEQVQQLAYRFWLQRGSPMGDPEEDWRKAEHELARQREAATRL